MTMFTRFTGYMFSCVLAFFLIACGGGGGGGSPVPVPPAMPSISLVSLAPANGTTGVPVSAAMSFVFAFQNASTFTQNFQATCNGTPVTLSVAQSINTAASTISYGVTLSNMPYSTGCSVFATQVIAQGVNGTSAPAVASVNFTTVAAPAWWPPATITAMGTKVFSPNTLPAGCIHQADQCWKDSVIDGTVKFVASSAVDGTGRPVVFSFFKNTSTLGSVTGLWNVQPMHTDDGSLASNDIGGGSASAIDWVTGSASGVIFHDVLSGACFEIYYQGAAFATRFAVCPP